jgi:hypothetical protein
MTGLWRNLFLASWLAGGAGWASAAQFEGILMDAVNSANAEVRIEPGGLLQGGLIVAEAYTRETALKPDSQKAGYGIFTTDSKFIAFDEAGNKKALAALRTSKREDDLKIKVTGEMKGDKLAVTAIQIEP